MHQDPDEPFDLCDERGRPIGRIKPRAQVHRDGDWHRSFHCWVVAPGRVVAPGERAGPAIVLQQRTPAKETWGGLWDVSVGGHYRAGEGLGGGLREIAEELGLQVAASELVHVGWRREEFFYPNGLIEREIQDIYFLRRELDLGTLAPDPSEVTAAALMPAAALARLADGRMTTVEVAGGPVRADGHVAPGTVVLAPESLVPRRDRYYRKAARFAVALARGEAAVQRRRWW
jgi:isopentenyldiphosphate isomerase